MKIMHVLEGVHIEEISDPALISKLRAVNEVKVNDIIEVKFGVHIFNLKVVEVSENRVVWKHINNVNELQKDNN